MKAEDFFDRPREARDVDSEAKVRRQIQEIYCKLRQDFENPEQFNDYLEMREDIIYKLTNPTSREAEQEVRRQLDKYQTMNAEQIMREQSLQPRKKAQRVMDVIEAEGSFANAVNGDWAAAAVSSACSGPPMQHAFKTRYRDLLLLGDTKAKRVAEPASPPARAAPQPMLECPCSPDQQPKDPKRHALGGGQSQGLASKKARFYFFADLAAAAAVAATKATATRAVAVAVAA